MPSFRIRVCTILIKTQGQYRVRRKAFVKNWLNQKLVKMVRKLGRKSVKMYTCRLPASAMNKTFNHIRDYIMYNGK